MKYTPAKDTNKFTTFYLSSVYISIFVFIARPGEFISVIATVRLVPISLLLLCLSYFLLDRSKKFGNQKVSGLKLWFYLVILSFISILFSIWPGKSFEVWWSVLLINTILVFFWLPMGLNLKNLYSMVLMIVLSVGALLVTMLFFKEMLFEFDRWYILGSSYDPNDLAIVLTSFFPLIVFLFIKSGLKGRLIWGLMSICLLIGVLKTGSRGGVLSLAIAIALLLLLPGRLGIKKWFKLFIMLILLAVFFSSAADMVKSRWELLLIGDDYNIAQTDGGATGRLNIWRAGAKIFLKYPVSGVGVGNSGTAIGLETNNWKTVHNSFLQIGMELGAIGLLIFMIILWSIWRNCTLAIRLLRVKECESPLLLLAATIRISLLSYMVGAFFLSQAYSIILPLLSVISIGVYNNALLSNDETSESVAID